MLSSQWDNDNQHFAYIIVSWYLLGIITRQGFLFSCFCMNRCTCGCLSWVRSLAEILSSNVLHCVQYRVIFYLDIPKTYSIPWVIWGKVHRERTILYDYTTDSPPTWLSSPMVSNIRKNNTAQTGDTGIRAMASGYAMNTSPGPVSRKCYKIYDIWQTKV